MKRDPKWWECFLLYTPVIMLVFGCVGLTINALSNWLFATSFDHDQVIAFTGILALVTGVYFSYDEWKLERSFRRKRL
tara:strand:- start:6441 stop:6674 length:234 start_codon:yes stop_codon:yes gene_type:complete